jgi:hypothetical protein
MLMLRQEKMADGDFVLKGQRFANLSDVRDTEINFS